MARTSRWRTFSQRRECEAASNRCGFPAAVTALSLSCISNRGRCWNCAGMPLGIVESIAAPASLDIVIEGAGGHAGGVLMPDRKDARVRGGGNHPRRPARLLPPARATRWLP